MIGQRARMMLVHPLTMAEKGELKLKLANSTHNPPIRLYFETIKSLETLDLLQSIKILETMNSIGFNPHTVDLMLQSLILRKGIEQGNEFLSNAHNQFGFKPTIFSTAIFCIGALDRLDFLSYSQYFRQIKRGWWPIPSIIFTFLLGAHLDLYLKAKRHQPLQRVQTDVWQSFHWTRKYQRIQHSFLNFEQLDNLLVALYLGQDHHHARFYLHKLKRKKMKLSKLALLFKSNPRKKWEIYDSLFEDTGGYGQRLVYAKRERDS